MPFYPIPVILVIIIWGLVFISTGFNMILGGLTVIGLGIIAFLIKSNRNKEWPFKKAL
jgi:hypothetical protein